MEENRAEAELGPALLELTRGSLLALRSIPGREECELDEVGLDEPLGEGAARRLGLLGCGYADILLETNGEPVPTGPPARPFDLEGDLGLIGMEGEPLGSWPGVPWVGPDEVAVAEQVVGPSSAEGMVSKWRRALFAKEKT